MHDHDEHPVEPAPEALTRHGLRCTRQRVALYEALHASKSHPTADELYRTVGPQVDGLSLATVYNTLDAFCRVGLVQKLAPSDLDPEGVRGSARYDATTHNHLHVRCKRTGAVRDVPDDLGQKLLDNLPADVLAEFESKLGFKIDQVQIELLGEYR
jgi:Fur family transcriptional regulator, peroxide stress response regulator